MVWTLLQLEILLFSPEATNCTSTLAMHCGSIFSTQIVLRCRLSSKFPKRRTNSDPMWLFYMSINKTGTFYFHTKLILNVSFITFYKTPNMVSAVDWIFSKPFFCCFLIKNSEIFRCGWLIAFNNRTSRALCCDITFGDISVFDSTKRRHEKK